MDVEKSSLQRSSLEQPSDLWSLDSVFTEQINARHALGSSFEKLALNPSHRLLEHGRKC